ncbi:hypothetical protein Aperf_G00000036702 [Anoplocephala perfoliata]
METNKLLDDRNISLRFTCRGSGDLPNIFIDFVYLCIAIVAMCLNILTLIGLFHITFTFNSKRFLEIRRSHNRGHPRFITRHLQHSKSVKTTRFHCDDDEDLNSFSNDGASSEFFLPRSPSCPDQMYYPRNTHSIFTTNSGNYWLNKANLGRKRTFKNSPQSKARLSTALYFVCSLTLADLLNASVTSLNLLLTFWRPSHAFVTASNRVYQIKAVEPCARLILATLLCTSYNASLCSIASLMLDLYLGVARSMHYRAFSKNVLLRPIFGFWALALLLGFLQVVLPAFQPQNINRPIRQRFLLPTEPCTIPRNLGQENFCLLRGAANIFRSGYVTGGLLFICALIMISLCALSLRKVRRDSLKRTRTMRIMASHRSASFPAINRVNGVAINVRAVNLNVPKESLRCIGGKLLRSMFTLLSLSAIFFIFFVPSLTLDAYFVLSERSPKLPSWIFDLVTHMPICIALFNPIIYSLRLSDIHVGLLNFKKRLLAGTRKGFIRKHLRIHREQILVNTNLTTHLRIKLPPQNGLPMREMK